MYIEFKNTTQGNIHLIWVLMRNLFFGTKFLAMSTYEKYKTQAIYGCIG